MIGLVNSRFGNSARNRERRYQHALMALSWVPGTSFTNHLAGLDPPKHAAEAIVATQGNAHPIPHRTQPRRQTSAPLGTRADPLHGRCVRCRGELERPAPGPGTGASGRALGSAGGRARWPARQANASSLTLTGQNRAMDRASGRRVGLTFWVGPFITCLWV